MMMMMMKMMLIIIMIIIISISSSIIKYWSSIDCCLYLTVYQILHMLRSICMWSRQQ